MKYDGAHFLINKIVANTNLNLMCFCFCILYSIVYTYEAIGLFVEGFQF